MGRATERCFILVVPSTVAGMRKERYDVLRDGKTIIGTMAHACSSNSPQQQHATRRSCVECRTNISNMYLPGTAEHSLNSRWFELQKKGENHTDDKKKTRAPSGVQSSREPTYAICACVCFAALCLVRACGLLTYQYCVACWLLNCLL